MTEKEWNEILPEFKCEKCRSIYDSVCFQSLIWWRKNHTCKEVQ